MRGTRLWLVVAMIAALFATAIVAGCGDDDDDDAATEEGAADLGLISDGTLTVASDIPYPPFEQGDPPDYEGFDIELAGAIGEEMGLEVKIIDMPFDPILQGGDGRFDFAVAATTIKPGREKAVDFSDPYFEAEQSLLVRADSGIASVEDITSSNVVGAQDGTTGETYAEDNTDAEIRPYQEIDDAYTALSNGQVDAVLNDVPSTSSVAADDPNLEVVETFPTEELYGIVFPEDSDALREAVNEALKSVKDAGTLNDLYLEWFDVEAPESLLEATHEPT